jgi:hypothetical protein
MERNREHISNIAEVDNNEYNLIRKELLSTGSFFLNCIISHTLLIS